MTQPEIEQLASLLRDHLPPVPAVEEMIASDILTIAPFIDSLIHAARKDGKFEAYLEICEANLHRPRPFANLADIPVPF